MKKIAAVVVFALLPATLPVAAEELSEGTWEGLMTIVRRGSSRPPLPHNLVVKKVQDPHRRWRPEGGEVLSVTQGGQPVSDVRLKDGTLSYSVKLPAPLVVRVRCLLERQEDDTYAGYCRGDGDETPPLRVTLSPPSETAATAPAP